MIRYKILEKGIIWQNLNKVEKDKYINIQRKEDLVRNVVMLSTKG